MLRNEERDPAVLVQLVGSPVAVKGTTAAAAVAVAAVLAAPRP